MIDKIMKWWGYVAVGILGIFVLTIVVAAEIMIWKDSWIAALIAHIIIPPIAYHYIKNNNN